MRENNVSFHVLVADDEESIRRTLQTVLETKGYRVTAVPNGLSALGVLDKEPVDIVIMDLKMPGMDGFELLAKITGISEHIPVVVITGYADVDSTARALKAGASDFLAKPFGAQDIYHAVSRLLEMRLTEIENNKVLPFLRHKLSIEIPSSMEYINGVVHFVMELVKSVNLFEPKHFTSMNIAIYEAVANAIDHGNVKDPGKKVAVLVDMDFERVRIVVRDEGLGFSPSEVESPLGDPNLHKASGRGLYLIKHFVDEVSHNSTGNEITMVKKRKSLPAATDGKKPT